MKKLALALLIATVISFNGPGLICLAGKLYYVSKVLDAPVLVLDKKGEPVKCEVKE